MSTDYNSENSEENAPLSHHSEGEFSGQSASGQSISLSLKSSDIFSAFRFHDILKLLKKFWYIIFLGVVGLSSLFFFLNLKPPPFEADTMLRIRAVKGKNQVSEAVSIKGEAEDLRSPKLIRSVLASLQRQTVVRPVEGISDQLTYFLEKRKQSGLISALQPDKYNFDLKHFTVDDGEGTFYVETIGNGLYTLYDQDKDEILQGRFGVLIEDIGLKIQVDAIYGDEGQWYELKYLSEDEMVAWAVDNISTRREGKDGEGGAIKLSFFTYDKVLLTRFLDAMGQEHVSNTEERLQKGTVKALAEKTEKRMILEQELFKQEKALEKLQRASAAQGNLATSANELRQQATIAEASLQALNAARDEAIDKYEDVRSIFSVEHPIVINARQDLEKIEEQIAEIEGSTDGIPELLMQINSIEESIESLHKEKQVLDEDIRGIEEIQKGSKSYISVSQEAQIRANHFTNKPPRMAVLGVLSGLVSSLLLIIVANLRIVKTLTLDGDRSSFSDGHSVDIENEGSTKSSSQFLSFEGEQNSHFEIEEEYSSQDAELLFQDYSSEMDSVSMYVSEMSSPSELDAPDVHSVDMSVMDLDSRSVMDAELDFLEQNLVAESAVLVSTGVWNSKAFSESALRLLQNRKVGVVEIVNNTDANILKAVIVHARNQARSGSVLVIDMQTDESGFGDFHNTNQRKGFWDVLAKKAPLKSCILQTTHRYFVMPAGSYSPSEVRMNRVANLIASVRRKFAHIVILHSQDVAIWRSIRLHLEDKGVLFWLQADYSLYQIGELSQPSKSGVAMDEVMLQLWGQARIIRLCNHSSRSLSSMLELLRERLSSHRILCIEATESGKSSFPSIAQPLRLAALLEGSCSLKDALHEISSNFYVIPASPFSYKEKEAKVQGIIAHLSKNFSKILVVQDAHFPPRKNEMNVELDESGNLRILEEPVVKKSS